jgi:preprotein translocase subunit SecA
VGKGPDQFESRFERKREAKERHLKEMPGEDEAPLPKPVDPIKKEKEEPGRNEPCPCGSGKKYKQCCLNKDKKQGWFSKWLK